MMPLAGHRQPTDCHLATDLEHSRTGQRLIAYCAAPGSATEAAFRQLASRSALLAWPTPAP